jgi:hypothetical protein
MKIQFKGIVRGGFSKYQAWGLEANDNPVVYTECGSDLRSVLEGFVLPEFLFTLHVNGRRIANPEKYLKEKGVWQYCIRPDEEAA